MKTVWPVVLARLVAVAGIFVGGSNALNMLPPSWQRPVSLISVIILAASASLPSVHAPANQPTNAAPPPADE